MPREEDLPPSKKGALNDEITKETRNFFDFIESDSKRLFSMLPDKERINLLITYINKQNAIYNLHISSLTEEIERLKNEIHKK